MHVTIPSWFGRLWFQNSAATRTQWTSIQCTSIIELLQLCLFFSACYACSSLYFVFKKQSNVGLSFHLLQVTQKFPFISSYRAFTVPSSIDVASLVKCQLAVASFDGNPYTRLPFLKDLSTKGSWGQCVLLQAVHGRSQDVTGLQLPGVLDDMFAYTGPLGAVFSEEAVSLYLWAPTAQVLDFQILLAPYSPYYYHGFLYIFHFY